MTDRWVCKRCFADNEGAAFACARCGLARGSEVTPADQQSWATEAGVAVPGAEQPGWSRWLRFWWIPAIAIVLAVGWFTAARRGDDGSLTSGGTLSVTDLRVGDCFNNDEESQEEITDVDAVPCDEPHEYEVFAVAEHESESFPTDSEFEEIFGSLCVPAFETYVGSSYATSALYAGFITPSETSFAERDREYACYRFEPVDPNDPDSANVELTGSMKGSGR